MDSIWYYWEIYTAIKFCNKANGKIDVVVASGDDVLQVSVTDNGKGIPENMTERIFEKFHQSLDSSED